LKLVIHATSVTLKRNNDLALVTGDGRSLPNDLRTFLDWRLQHDVLAIGRSINLYPGRVEHWLNVDGADSSWWAEHLQLKNDGKMPIRHSLGECKGYDVDWDDGRITNEPWRGSTALFAVYVALALGYEKIVLAGCPLDSKGHWFYDPEVTGPEWLEEDYEAWRELARTPEGNRVRSLSGNTAEIIGLAKEEWCNG